MGACKQDFVDITSVADLVLFIAKAMKSTDESQATKLRMCCIATHSPPGQRKTRLQGRRVFSGRGGRDSNPQHPARQAGTLTN